MVVYKKKKEYIPVFKDVETLVNEGYTPEEIQVILEVQQTRGWNEEVPSLVSIKKTRRKILRSAEGQVKINEFWDNKNTDKHRDINEPLQEDIIYRKQRFLGKIYSFIGTTYLRKEIKKLQNRDRAAYFSSSKYRIAREALRLYKKNPYYHRTYQHDKKVLGDEDY